MEIRKFVFLICLLLTFAFKPITVKEKSTMMYGICNLSTIPVRATHSHKSEIVTQLLFGEVYTVTDQSEDGEWKKIKIDYDGYEGWIADFQFKEVSQHYFDQYQQTDHVVNHQALTEISHPTHGRHFISIGSVLPFYKDGAFRIGDDTFQLENQSATKRHSLILTAEKYMQTPYLWGGKSIFGIDCSGFVQQVFKSALNLKLPRDAYQQAEQGEIIAYENVIEGDLAFFANKSGRITHVGILTGKGEIIHASGRVKIDRFSQAGIISKETGEETHQLSFIKRVALVD